MDPGIWRNLPEELLYHILTFLSPKTIFNLRSTCKRFKSLLFDPCFLSHYSFSSSTFSSFLLLSHPHFHRHFPLYDSLSATWRLPLRHSSAASSALITAANGLLCFTTLSSSFLISNPLSRASTLVKFPTLPFSFEILTLISLPTGFQIFVISSSNAIFLYDSRSGSWGRYNLLDSKILNDSFHQGGVYYNGHLYLTTCDPFSVVSFDLGSGHWSGSRFELPTNELAFLRLASGEDRLYMIGGVGSNGISRCLKLWELGEDEMWVEIERLPELMYKRLVSVCYHNYEHIYCFWHQGMICICCYTYPEVLYYRIGRRTWHWLPKCPALPDKWSCGFRWFPFVPTLNAPV